MEYIDSFGWSLNIILLICFVTTLLMLMKKPKDYDKKNR